MEERIKILDTYYDGQKEDLRLVQSRRGQLEFMTTMHYIHKLLSPNANIIEVGAGTGRYSIALAREGHQVTAVELVEKNLEVLRKNSMGTKNINVVQGDALDLSRFQDEIYDMTLVFGPLYHLYEEKDRQKALEEAIRVTKKGGIIMVAFLSVHGLLLNNFYQGRWAFGIENNFSSDYQVRHFTEQLFTGFDIEEFEKMFEFLPVEWITTVSTDSILELVKRIDGFSMSEEDFTIFSQFHLAHCEKRELLGYASHLLYLCRKQ